MKGSIELAIPSELGWERTAMELAASVARLMGFPADRVDDVKTAVVEATLNAIEHGNQFDANRAVSIVITPVGDRLEVVVRDQSSRPIEPPTARPDLEDQIAGRAPRRGWGIFLIRALVDDVEFESSEGGNLVRMVIRAQQRTSDGPN